ncbi:MAG: Asp-tRNA(Asn)/Glu-tRNA(Gln) amidotransferase subunit GatC [Candidatus Nanohaloarchaea archaeon]
MVSREEILEVAENARLELTDEEVEELGEDFEEILESFQSLDEMDTEGVEPSLHPVDIEGRTREDEEEECLSQEEALENAENTENGYFKGPRSV